MPIPVLLAPGQDSCEAVKTSYLFTPSQSGRSTLWTPDDTLSSRVPDTDSFCDGAPNVIYAKRGPFQFSAHRNAERMFPYYADNLRAAPRLTDPLGCQPQHAHLGRRHAGAGPRRQDRPRGLLRLRRRPQRPLPPRARDGALHGLDGGAEHVGGLWRAQPPLPAGACASSLGQTPSQEAPAHQRKGTEEYAGARSGRRGI